MRQNTTKYVEMDVRKETIAHLRRRFGVACQAKESQRLKVLQYKKAGERS